MDDQVQGTLSDEDIRTILPVGGVGTKLETDPDTDDADGTDGDSRAATARTPTARTLRMDPTRTEPMAKTPTARTGSVPPPRDLRHP